MVDALVTDGLAAESLRRTQITRSAVLALDEDLLTLYEAAVRGAEPRAATTAAIQRLDLAGARSIRLFAFGKAAQGMAESAVEVLLGSLREISGGLIVTPDIPSAPYPTMQACRGDHPVPGGGSLDAAIRLGEVSAGRKSSDIAIVLVSGGTSSLIGAPLRQHQTSDFVALNEVLLGSGLDIVQMNIVRKRFSRWAGGRLALALAPAATHCIAISDVPGDDLRSIGSGPCSPDSSTAGEVRSLLEGAGLLQRIAPAYRDYLTAVERGAAPETPKPPHPAFAHVTTEVVAGNRTAVESAASAAEEAGFRVEISEPQFDGPAIAAGEAIAHRLIAARATRNALARCVIWGGETTVSLPAGSARLGDGGRCQEMALAAARVFAGAGERSKGIRLLIAGTDGRDGRTDAAGAIVDSDTWNAIEERGHDPMAALREHASTRALDSVNALIPRRHTGTNVMDVAIGIIE